MNNEFLHSYALMMNWSKKLFDQMFEHADIAENASGFLGNAPQRWDLINEKTGYTAAHFAARRGTLPKEFNQWELKNKKNGFTVAHWAASGGHLPKDFNQWDLKDDNGNTVAHWAARCGNLRASFNRWDLKNNFGETVAYTAFKHGHLPDSFPVDKINLIPQKAWPEHWKDYMAKNQAKPKLASKDKDDYVMSR